METNIIQNIVSKLLKKFLEIFIFLEIFFNTEQYGGLFLKSVYISSAHVDAYWLFTSLFVYVSKLSDILFTLHVDRKKKMFTNQKLSLTVKISVR